MLFLYLCLFRYCYTGKVYANHYVIHNVYYVHFLDTIQRGTQY